ncbi:MAG: hypothetical protein LBU83_10115, partial [Bacteroidales bacterium]|nr:hypothetical protein [Bacteroidales bacterium]
MKSFTLKLRSLAILLACMALSINAVAQDVIKFTWTAGTMAKSFTIQAALAGSSYSFDWGDGNTGSRMYMSGDQTNSYTYAIPGSYDVVITGNNVNCVFTYFHCVIMQVTALDVSEA